jgi:hypothetical protein
MGAVELVPKRVQVAPRQQNRLQVAEAAQRNSAVRTIVTVPNDVAGAIHPLSTGTGR